MTAKDPIRAALAAQGVNAEPRPIFLVGMMGAGKTTIGGALAASLDCVFVDLDRRIERIWGRDVADLFAEGEAGFRRHERAALHSLVREPGFARRLAVVATGGGVLTTPGNRALMACGHVVYLRVPAAQLVARLSAPNELAARPMLSLGGGSRTNPSTEREGAAVPPAATESGKSPHDITHVAASLPDRIHWLLEARAAGYESADVEVDASAPVESVVASIVEFVSSPRSASAVAPSAAPPSAQPAPTTLPHDSTEPG